MIAGNSLIKCIKSQEEPEHPLFILNEKETFEEKFYSDIVWKYKFKYNWLTEEDLSTLYRLLIQYASGKRWKSLAVNSEVLTRIWCVICFEGLNCVARSIKDILETKVLELENAVSIEPESRTNIIKVKGKMSLPFGRLLNMYIKRYNDTYKIMFEINGYRERLNIDCGRGEGGKLVALLIKNRLEEESANPSEAVNLIPVISMEFGIKSAPLNGICFTQANALQETIEADGELLVQFLSQLKGHNTQGELLYEISNDLYEKIKKKMVVPATYNIRKIDFYITKELLKKHKYLSDIFKEENI